MSLLNEEDKNDFVTYIITAFLGALIYMLTREIKIAEKEQANQINVLKTRHECRNNSAYDSER